MTSLIGKIIIPARMASSRFPGKPLFPIKGLPMVEHVRRRCMLVEGISEVWVATCDEEIKEVVEGFGGNVILTANTHERPTERIQEAASKIGGDYFIMVQGDEPLVNPASLARINEKFISGLPKNEVVNLIHPVVDEGELESRNVVKVVFSKSDRIILFSRSHIPCAFNSKSFQSYKQSGIICFSKSILDKYVGLESSPLEIQESCDMLRFVENDIDVIACLEKHETKAVDHPEHAGLIEEELSKNQEQTAIYERILQL